MATTTIDYSAFPHIVRLVLRHAPHSVLVAFRATCKTLKDTVTPILCEHIQLTTSYPLVINITTPYGGRIPGLKQICLDQEMVAKDLDTILPFTKHTKVVDIVGYTELDLTFAGAAFPNLDTTRIVTCDDGGFTTYFPFQCNTVVIYFSACGPQPHDSTHTDSMDEDMVDFYYQDLRSSGRPVGHNGRIPEGVTRVVLNMSGTSNKAKFHFNLKVPSTLRDFVIVYPMYVHDRPKGRFQMRNNLTTEAEHWVKWGGRVGRLINRTNLSELGRILSNKARYIVVGVDEGNPGVDIHNELRGRPPARNSASTRPTSSYMKMTPEAREEILSNHLVVMTKDEYAKEVGDEVDLHVVESFKPGCHDKYPFKYLKEFGPEEEPAQPAQPLKINDA